MSKYNEALEEIKNKKVIICKECDERMHSGCLCCQNTYTTCEQIDILKEAVEKAEFVDAVASGKIKASMGKYGIMAMNRETYKKWRLEDNEPISKRFLMQENQILKDGINEILKRNRLFNHDFKNEKIKAMVEVVKNEQV